MSRRKYSSKGLVAIAVVAIAVIGVGGVAALVVGQKIAATKPKVAAGQAASGAGAKAGRGKAAGRPVPIRPADPNRAPQAAVDDALYTNQEFFGVSASVARPYSDALGRLYTLLTQYPKDARLHLQASRLAERLSQFDRSAKEMGQYADLEKRSPAALRRLADFDHHRALFADEAKTLQELARAVPIAERSVIYKRAAAVVRSHSLKEFTPADFFRELVAADPTNIQPVRDYVEELRLAKRNKEALDLLASFQPKFPSETAYFLKQRAQILEATSGRRAAEDVYSSAFDPNWPRAVAGDYYDLLRRFGRYRIVRRDLQHRVGAGATELDTVARLFSVYSYEGDYEQAGRLLRDLEERRGGKPQGGGTARSVASQSAWSGRELETAAEMFASIGDYDQASRYLYTLYLTGGLAQGSQQREDALYRLFAVMLDASGTPTRVGTGDLSFYKDIAAVDRHPGFLNGVLSLVLSDSDPASELASEETAAAGYFNKAFAYRIFTAFEKEYPQSPRLGDMYLGVVNVFAGLNEHRLAIEAGREFRQRFPDSPKYVDVSLRLADSYVALKDRVNERAVLGELLDRLAKATPKGVPLVPVAAKDGDAISPKLENLIDRIEYNIEAYGDAEASTESEASSEDSGESGNETTPEAEASESSTDTAGNTEAAHAPSYSSVLERYVSSLAAEDKKTETVAFFWAQIRKHPSSEGLYERFLSWLGSAELVNEQLKAYNSAIRRFDSGSWYQRLARWYVRQKRGRELGRYSHQLIDIFNEEEITDYLLGLEASGAKAAGDDIDWDQRLSFDLYSYAHTHFPRNLFFVRGMLKYYEEHDRAPWEKLSAQYYFADRSIREPYLAWLSKQGQLRDKYADAWRRVSPATPAPAPNAVRPVIDSLEASPLAGQPSTDAAALTTYRIFAADAAAWLSHYDKAVEVYRDLVASYPGTPQYAERLSSLARSFGQQDESFYDESAAVYARMAEIYPSEHAYRIKAGEAYAERGEFQRAGEQWDKLIQLEPGERSTYLEVATVYWDYFQFDQAIRVFKELRSATGDQTIYAYRLGAVYEGKGDIDSAISEYVKVLPEPGDGRDTVAKRLAQLSRRPGLEAKIAAAYEQARAASPNDWQLVVGYARYQVEREHQADALAILRTEISRSQDVAFLETMRNLFRGILRPEDEQQAITRLTSVARDERESMMYNLQLASFLERHNQKDQAIGVIDKLVADHPTNVGVVEESAQFYWRAGMRDRAIELYQRTLADARGPNRRRFALQLARRQVDAKRAADAETTLRAAYAENRSDTEVFSELTRTLGAQNKLAELATLYKEALSDVRQSGLAGDEARARVVELRKGMIRTFTDLAKYEDAVDQYIEIVNSYPEDDAGLAEAIGYAESHDQSHNLADRFIGYYQKLSKDSFKDYRWELVLGRIYEHRGNLADAGEQYRLAVVNEPQRADLRFTLASILARQRRFDEAIATLREGWTLAGRDPVWLVEVARLQVQQGKRDDAIQTMRQALAAKKNTTAAAQLAAAARLASWGLTAEAANIYSQVFTRLPKTLKDDVVSPSDVSGYVRALIATAPAGDVFNRIERMRAQFVAISENSKDTDGYKSKGIVRAIDDAMRADFGRGVIDYASPSEASALAAALQGAVAPMTAYTDNAELLRYLGIARASGLVETEEQIQIRLKDIAFKARTKPEQSIYYDELRSLVAFYNRHQAYARAAELLAASQQTDPYKDRFDYENQIATEYRLSGDQERELASLSRAYAAASGAATTGNTDWVDRYLTLLYSSGKKYELAKLASAYNPHQLQLINFLIDKREKDLARAAIANATRPAAWAASRSAEVGLFLRDFSPDTETFFKDALKFGSIGEMIGRHVDTASVLVGNDWFVEARNYGYWLGLQDARQADSRRFLAGQIEGHPSSANAQLELAAYYLDRHDAAGASAHTSLAEELAPGDRQVAVMRGEVALARGDRKGALEAWSAMISRGAGVGDAQIYLGVMADHGFLAEALRPLEDFTVGFVNASSSGASRRVDEVKALAREIAGLGDSDARGAVQAAAFFENVLARLPDDTTLARTIIEEKLLPEANLASIYRIEHQRLSHIAASVMGTPEYENGYYDRNADTYIYPAQALADFRRRLIDYLIRRGSLPEARLLVTTIEREQSDLGLATESNGGSDDSSGSRSEDRYNWLPLASALIDLRGGEAAKGVAVLRRYCGLKDKASPDRAGPRFDADHLNTQCLKAYSLLVAEHKTAEADDLLYDAYQAAAQSRYPDETTLAGLAEIEARRGRGDEAARLLRAMVERSTDNGKALQLASETAARIGRYADAIEFRQQIALANPDDAINALELARLVAATGKNGDALDRIIALMARRATSNTVRAQAAEIAGDIAHADAAEASRRAPSLDQRAAAGDAGAALMRAAIAESGGASADAHAALSRITSGGLAAVAQLKLGRLSLAEGRDQDALTAFERAIYLDADGVMTDAILFKGPGPAAELISLYSRMGRELAAIRMVEDQPPGQRPLISAAIKNALKAGGGADSNKTLSVVFEPSPEPRTPASSGLQTLSELNEAGAARAQAGIVVALVEAAARLGRYDRAIALERLRALDAAAADKAAIDKKLADLIAARKVWEAKNAVVFHIDWKNATESVYAAR